MFTQDVITSSRSTLAVTRAPASDVAPAHAQTGMVEMSEAFKHKGAEVYLEPAALS